ncbi:hypothetical protein EJB05_37922, partial [Eragrostis curvula]
MQRGSPLLAVSRASLACRVATLSLVRSLPFLAELPLLFLAALRAAGGVRGGATSCKKERGNRRGKKEEMCSLNNIDSLVLQAYCGSQVLQSIILLCTGTNTGGGYLAPPWLFLVMYLGLTLIWAVLNTFPLEEIAILDVISMWWQVVGGAVIVVLLPLVAKTTQPASYVFTHFQKSPEVTGISSSAYAVVLSFLMSQYSLFGYDAAAHLTEETKGADRNGPIAILTSDFSYLYDTSNETAGTFVPAQILYDAFHGRYGSSTGAIVLLFVIWASFFFGGLSCTTSAARVVYALSRDRGVPFSAVWRRIHPRHKVPANAVWLCAAVCALMGLPILRINVVFTAISSVCTIGWVGGYAVPIFARMVMREEDFKPGPFYLGRASRPVCLVAFLWICYTCCVFMLPTSYPIKTDTFNYAPVALSVCLGLIMLWWVVDARKWFKGPQNSETIFSSILKVSAFLLTFS